MPSRPFPRPSTLRPRLAVTTAVLLGAVAATAFVACGSPSPEPEPVDPTASAPASPEVRREAGLDILLITIDTLRADALGSYGRAGAGTPWMDRLAETGVRFTDAHAHNVVTLPSHANLLSGLLPHEHGVRDNAGFRFPDDVETLATILGREGYRTGAFVSAFPLDARFGLDRGFDVYEDSFVDSTPRPTFLEQERPGTETVARALEWLAEGDERPTFTWVHLYEPHFPYAPPEPFASRFADEPYQGDVAAADAALEPLLRPILEAGKSGDTLVVLTSDHGEALGEHGEATHGIFAYEGVLRVPLVLHQSRLFGPRVVDVPASHVDVLPTVLDVLSVPVPAGIAGRSLLPAAAGAEALHSEEEVYFEALSGQLNRGWAPLFGVLHERDKYVDLPIPELYDLDVDPGELRNLADERPDRVADLRERLARFRADDPGPTVSPEEEEVRRRLRSLGYLGGGSAPADGPWTAEDDPKNLVEVDAALREVAGLYAAGRLDEALRLCRSLARQRPGMRIALIELAHLEREAGNLDRAIPALRKAFELAPHDPTTLSLLATYLVQDGRLAEALDVTAPHTELPEPDVEVLLTRSLALARAGRAADAFGTLERATTLDPGNPKVPVYRGTLLLMGGRREEARAAYQEALEMAPAMVRARTALGILAAEDGRTDDAVRHWRVAANADPEEIGRLLGFGLHLWTNGDRAVARPLLELFLEVAPSERHREDIPRVRELLQSASPDG